MIYTTNYCEIRTEVYYILSQDLWTIARLVDNEMKSLINNTFSIIEL